MTKCKFAPTVFYRVDRDISCVMHEDDLTFLGWQKDVESVASFPEQHYELKPRGVLGGQEGVGANDIVSLSLQLP